MSRSLSALARLLSALLLLASSSGRAAAHGTDNVVMGSTADGGGSLFAGYDYTHHVLVTPSATIAGFTVHTSNDPGLTPLLADDAANGEYVLNDGTTLSFTLAAPLDAGVSVKIGSTVLDAVGETALVGTFDAANADQFHVHPTWTLTVPAGTTTARQVSFRLTAPGYDDSPVYTLVLSNVAPSPTATDAATPTPTPTATPGPAHLDGAAAKSAVKCAAGISGAAATHARAVLAGTTKCAQAVLRCVQLDAAAACLAKAATACGKVGAKIDAGIAKLAAVAVKKCGALGLADVRAAAGLGFDSALATCTSLGETLDDLASVGRCVARTSACRAVALADAAVPRAGEALRLVGQTVASAGCLPDHGGSGAGLGDPKGAGKALLKCEAAAATSGAKVLQARLARTDKCLGALFACVQQRSGDAGCVADADGACAAGDAKVAAAEAKLAASVAKQCGPLAFAALAAADGAGLAGLAATCAAHGVAALASLDDHRECLQRTEACGAADLAALAAPRAAELAALAGFPLRDSFCPEAP